MGPKQVLPFQVRLNLGVMAVTGYCTSPKAPGLELHHQMHQIQDTHWRGVTSLLLPQLIGPRGVLRIDNLLPYSQSKISMKCSMLQ